MVIDPERLASLFVKLCEIDSPSFHEGRVAAFLKRFIANEFPSARMVEDDSAARTGSESGNLVVRFEGSLPLAPVFFACHLDTVQPGEGIAVLREGSVFSSQGETVLGGDDKSGIAILLEVMRGLLAEGHPHGPVELVFTTCEEVGLLGAKHFNRELLRARIGYALDSTGLDQVIIGAPAANQITATIRGLAAHAGLNPELGINAIQLAGLVLAGLRQGRLDEESTSNIGLIAGGTARNIISETVTLKGEVRSHSAEKLARFTREMEAVFAGVVNAWRDPTGRIEARPSYSFEAALQYPALRLSADDEVIRRIDRAAAGLSRPLQFIVAGGGSDANIFNGAGLKTAILSTGMQHVHSTAEQIDLADMVRTAELVRAILTS